MTQPKFDPAKPCATIGGCKVRIYATDGCAPYPIHGAYFTLQNAQWHVGQWTETGSYLCDGGFGCYDLVNTPAPVRLKRWVMVLADPGGCYSTTGFLYNVKPATRNRENIVALVEVDIDTVEGAGLEEH